MSFILTMRTQGFGEECGVRVSRRKRSEGEGCGVRVSHRKRSEGEGYRRGERGR